MVGDWGSVKSAEGIPPPGGQTNCGEDGSEYGVQRVGMVPSGIRHGYIWYIAHQELHSVAAGHH